MSGCDNETSKPHKSFFIVKLLCLGFGVTREALCELITTEPEEQKLALKELGGVAGIADRLKVRAHFLIN